MTVRLLAPNRQPSPARDQPAGPPARAARPAAGESPPASLLTGALRPSDAGEPALIARAARGEEAALAALLDRYHDALFRQIVWLTGDATTAEDVSQETWWRIVRGLPRFRGEASFFTWAVAIARREVKRQAEKRAPHRRHAALEGVPEPVAPDTRAQAELAEALRSALGRLPERERVPIVLQAWEGLTTAEIAATLGVALGTVQSRLARGRKRLRAAWANQHAGQPARSPQTEPVSSSDPPSPHVGGPS